MTTQFYSKDFYDNNMMSITVLMIDMCNYSCKYCCNRFPRTNKQLNLEQLAKFIKHLKTLTTKKLQVTLIGGETMLHPDIYSFCNDMKIADVECMIFSNFSLPYKYYDQFDDNVVFSMSWHSSNTDIFLENVEKIQIEKLDRYIFYVMYEHDNIDKSINAFNRIKSRTKKVQLKKIFNTIQYNKLYTAQQLKIYDNIIDDSIANNVNPEDTYELISNNKTIQILNIQIDEAINPFRHWKCYSGLDNLYVTIDGDIYPCCTLQPLHIFESSVEIDKQKMGNIDSYQYFKLKPVMFCTSPRCCNYEIKKDNILNKKFDKFLQGYIS